MDNQLFLSEIFGNKPEESLITIFSLPDRKSVFFKDPQEATQHALKLKDRHVYFSTYLLENSKPVGRGKAEDTVGIPALFADIDIGDIHSCKQLPNFEADALNLVKGHGFDPSIIVNSGHGIHAYWIFKEVWIFGSQDDRDVAHSLLLRLQETIRAKANLKGWNIDYTADLARVLRVPGTYNIKIKDNPVLCQIIESTSLRYNPEDFEPFLVSEVHKRTPLSNEIQQQIAKNIEINPIAEPPADKLDQLMEVNEVFKSSWNARRSEFGDDPSRYAQSLANYAAEAQWSEQEIVNLLIAFYRRHLDNPLFKNRAVGKEPISLHKIMRPVKLAITIGKAKQHAKQKTTENYIDEIEPAECSGMGDIVDPNGEKARAFISAALKLEILGIKKYLQEEGKDPFYEMELKKSNGDPAMVTFKNQTILVTQASFRDRIFGVINDMPQYAEKNVWGKILRAFGKIIQEEEVVGSSSTIVGKMKMWLEQYLLNKPILNSAAAYRAHQPFVDGGHWYVFAKPFTDWAWQNKGQIEGISRSELNLKRIGASFHRFNFDDPSTKERIQFRAWKIPLNVVIPPPKVVVDNTKNYTEPNECDEKAFL